MASDYLLVCELRSWDLSKTLVLWKSFIPCSECAEVQILPEMCAWLCIGTFTQLINLLQALKSKEICYGCSVLSAWEALRWHGHVEY